MGILSSFNKLFNTKRAWNGTPEMFLAMAMFMQKKNNPNYSKHEVLQWGELLQKVIKVSLSPFKDFADLVDRGEPDFSVVQQIEDKVSEMRQRIELKKAIYGENADLGDDDIMTSNSDGAVFARKFVDDLSQHIQFSEEENRKNHDAQ
ncbi:MAG TPA: hypothetical protein VKZ98_07080 [Aquaticitalea sp.]|nr:hypothetical protein [Aquaticitalea sp.]